MSKRPFRNPKVKICPECKNPDMSKLSTGEKIREAFYQFWGFYPDETPSDHPISIDKYIKEANKTSDM